MTPPKTELYSCYGCTVYRSGERYFVRYDSGGSVSWDVENEITPLEAEIIKRSERAAYEVIMAAAKRQRPKRVD